MHKLDLRIFRRRHQLRRNAVISQQINAFLPSFFRLTHADPHISMDKIHAFYGFLHILRQQNPSAGLFGNSLHRLDNVFRRPQTFRCTDTHVHAQFRS